MRNQDITNEEAVTIIIGAIVAIIILILGRRGIIENAGTLMLVSIIAIAAIGDLIALIRENKRNSKLPDAIT